MIVCSRCAGIYAGMLLGSVLAGPLRGFPWYRSLVLLSAALMLLEVLVVVLEVLLMVLEVDLRLQFLISTIS